jgi:hypothetical protein
MSSKALALTIALLAVAPAAQAETDGDPGVASSSLFKARAETVSRLGLEKLKLELKKAEAELGGDTKVKTDEQSKPPAKTVQPIPALTEIGGSGGHLVAVFTYPDGDAEEAIPHQRVAGFGMVKSITATAVEDEGGHWHAVLDR